HQRIQTLTPDSTLDSLEYQITPVRSYVRSLMDVDHTLVEIETASGKTLRLTENHPVLTASGVMRTADSIFPGDLLVQVEGTADKVIAARTVKFHGKVYNVYVDSEDLQENIVVAEGILNGSALY